jgi:hypothetical protein
MVKIAMTSDFEKNEIGISHNFRNYERWMSKFTNQTYEPTPLTLGLKMEHSSNFKKWDLTFKNLFFYNINNNLWEIDLLLNYTTKKIKYINFDVYPNYKLTFTSDTVPLKLTLKHGQYQSSRNQDIVGHDFSKVIQSMLPYSKSSISCKLLYGNTFWFGKDHLSLYSYAKAGYNKIHKYEDNLKLSGSVKAVYENNTFTDLFTIQLSNRFTVKKSLPGVFDTRNFEEPHITSGYDFNSKILGFNILETESVIDNRNNFMIQNLFELRLKNLWFLKLRNLNNFEPFICFETLFVPHYTEGNINWTNSLKFIATTGVSIRIQDYLTFDISLYTMAKSTPSIKPSLVNGIRININLESDLN